MITLMTFRDELGWVMVRRGVAVAAVLWALASGADFRRALELGWAIS